MNKKVDVVFDFFPPSMGGLQNNLFQTYTRLVTMGWDVAIHTLNYDPATGDRFSDFEVMNGVKVYRYDHFTYNFMPFLIKIRKGIDLLCLHDFIVLPHYYFYVTNLVKFMLGIKRPTLILSSHGLFSLNLSAYKGFEYAKRKLKRFIDLNLGVVLAKSIVDAIRVPSLGERDALVKAGFNPAMINVISNGADFDEIPSSEDGYSENIKKVVADNTPYIFQMGRIDRIKNFGTPIHALKNLPENLKFLVVGPAEDSTYYEELKKLVSDLGLETRVKFLGTIKGPDRYYIMKNAIANTHLSINEGFGNVVNESMVMGCPCIVSSETATRELVQDGVNGFQMIPTDTGLLAEKIKWLLDPANLSKVSQIKANNIEASKDKSWANVSTKVNDLYIKVIEKKNV